MKFTVKREEFLKTLLIANRAIESKNANPILNNLKLDLNEKGLFITGACDAITINTFVPYNSGEQPLIRNFREGSILLNAKIITEIAKKMESEEITVDVIDSTIAVISDSRSEYKLNCMKTNEYPNLDFEMASNSLRLSRSEFGSIVYQTAFAASIKEQRKVLTALNLEAGEGKLIATATDSARLAKKEIAINGDFAFNANIPAKIMVEIDHLIEGCEFVDIAISDSKALFSFGRTIVSSSLIPIEYPNTKNIVPKSTSYSLEVNSADLIKAIDRVNILSVERENIVDLNMNESGIEISAKSSQVGSASEKIETFRFEGEDLKVSFNSEFVIAAVRALNSEDVTFEFVGEMKPFVIKNQKDNSVVQVVTPVRTY